MHLENIQLENFKNYEGFKIHFSPQINCVLGANGVGKTNMLDAIHYLCLAKSAFNHLDKQLIFHSADYFFVKGAFSKSKDTFNVLASLKQGGQKKLKCNDFEYEKLSDHIGLLPVVFVRPNDSDIIYEGSEERRRFFDNVISQYDKEYLHQIIQYKYVIKQRNALLKQFSDRRFIDKDLIEPYDIQVIDLSYLIYEKRRKMMSEFLPLFNELYERLSGNKEVVTLEYHSGVNDVEFKKKYKESLDRDIFLQRTTNGIHKDDYRFKLDDQSLKKFGSQGQQKTFVVALQLAKLKLLEIKNEICPILLLDDIFDKLDENRMQILINMIAREEFGQVFISDARPERSKQLLTNIKLHVSFLEIDNGKMIDYVEKK